MSLIIGNVKEVPGKIVRGTLDLMELPTGGVETLPLVIASGKQPGPTLLLTANIHGGEIAGIVVCHRFLEQLDLNSLSGRVVCIPSLNPSGLRAGTRYPQFEAVDPNRKWPDANPDKKELLDKDDWLYEFSKKQLEGTQEIVWARLFETFKKIAPDFAVDLHTFSACSIPFAITDRAFVEDKPAGEALIKKQDDMLMAMGFTRIIDMPAKNHVHFGYHRTTSSAILNNLHIPACTIELGPTNEVNPENRDAALQSLTNLLRWGGMLPGTPEPLKGIPVIDSEKLHRFLSYPFTPCAGIADAQLKAGDMFKKGDTLAVIRKIDGTVLSELKADFDGFVIAWYPGIAVYEGQSLGWVGAPDRSARILSWSEV